MSVRQIAPIVVVGLAAILAATGLITFAFGDEPDYAHLVPAPDAIIWTEGDEIPLWVSTNRETVDVRVSSIDLGIGEINLRNPSSALPVPLGAGLGCLDSVPTEIQEVHLLADTGVSLLACDAAEDIAVTLHGDGGEELNRYLVDVLAVATSTPQPARYETRRVCVDSIPTGTSTPDYLSGGELVGDAFDAADFGLSGTVTYALGDVVEGSGHVFFFVWGTTSGQIEVSAAGAADVLGLDADRVYQVRVTATDAYGASGYKDVGVWLDISDPDGLSPSDNGLCS